MPVSQELTSSHLFSSVWEKRNPQIWVSSENFSFFFPTRVAASSGIPTETHGVGWEPQPRWVYGDCMQRWCSSARGTRPVSACCAPCRACASASLIFPSALIVTSGKPTAIVKKAMPLRHGLHVTEMTFAATVPRITPWSFSLKPVNLSASFAEPAVSDLCMQGGVESTDCKKLG